MTQSFTLKFFQDIYASLSDADKIAYVDSMYAVCMGDPIKKLPTSLHTKNKLKIFHLRPKPAEFNSKDYIQSTLTSPRGYLRIIGLYLLASNVTLTSKTQAGAVINRHSRDAKLLEPWLETEEMKKTLKAGILDTGKQAREGGYNFTLQTVYKNLTSN